MFILVIIRDWIDAMAQNPLTPTLNFSEFMKKTGLFCLTILGRLLFHILTFQWLFGFTRLVSNLPVNSWGFSFPVFTNLSYSNHFISNLNSIVITQLFKLLSFSAVPIYLFKRLHFEGLESVWPLLVGFFLAEFVFSFSIYSGFTSLLITFYSWERSLAIGGALLALVTGVKFLSERREEVHYKLRVHARFFDLDQQIILLIDHYQEVIAGFLLFWLDYPSLFTILGNLTATPTVSIFESFEVINNGFFYYLFYLIIHGSFISLLIFYIHPIVKGYLIGDIYRYSTRFYFKREETNSYIRKTSGLLLFFLGATGIPFYTLEYILGGTLGWIPKDSSLFHTFLDPYFLSDSPGYYEDFYRSNAVAPFKASKFDNGRYLLHPMNKKEVPPSYEDTHFKPCNIGWLFFLKANTYSDKFLIIEINFDLKKYVKSPKVKHFLESITLNSEPTNKRKNKKDSHQMLTSTYTGTAEKFYEDYPVPYSEKLFHLNKSVHDTRKKKRKGNVAIDMVLGIIRFFISASADLSDIPGFDTFSDKEQNLYIFRKSQDSHANRIERYLDYLSPFISPNETFCIPYYRLINEILKWTEEKKVFDLLDQYLTKLVKLSEARQLTTDKEEKDTSSETHLDLEDKQNKTNKKPTSKGKFAAKKSNMELLKGIMPYRSVFPEAITTLFPKRAYKKYQAIRKFSLGLGILFKQYTLYYNPFDISKLFFKGHSFNLTTKQTLDLHYKQLYQAEALLPLRYFSNESPFFSVAELISKFSTSVVDEFMKQKQPLYRSNNEMQDLVNYQSYLSYTGEGDYDTLFYLLLNTTRSFENKVFNHQFKGTFIDLAPWFSLSPYNSVIFQSTESTKVGSKKIELDEKISLLDLDSNIKKYYPIIKYDQALYKDNLNEKGIALDSTLFTTLITDLYSSLIKLQTYKNPANLTDSPEIIIDPLTINNLKNINEPCLYYIYEDMIWTKELPSCKKDLSLLNLKDYLLNKIKERLSIYTAEISRHNSMVKQIIDSTIELNKKNEEDYKKIAENDIEAIQLEIDDLSRQRQKRWDSILSLNKRIDQSYNDRAYKSDPLFYKAVAGQYIEINNSNDQDDHNEDISSFEVYIKNYYKKHNNLLAEKVMNDNEDSYENEDHYYKVKNYEDYTKEYMNYNVEEEFLASNNKEIDQKIYGKTIPTYKSELKMEIQKEKDKKKYNDKAHKEYIDKLKLEISGDFRYLDSKSPIYPNILDSSVDINEALQVFLDYLTLSSYSLTELDTLLTPFFESMFFAPLTASNLLLENNPFTLSTLNCSLHNIELPVKSHPTNKWPLPSTINDRLSFSENSISFRKREPLYGTFLQVPYERYIKHYLNKYVIKENDLINKNELYSKLSEEEREFETFMDLYRDIPEVGFESLEFKVLADIFKRNEQRRSLILNAELTKLLSLDTESNKNLKSNTESKQKPDAVFGINSGSKRLMENQGWIMNEYMVPSALQDTPIGSFRHKRTVEIARESFYNKSPIRGGFRWAGSYIKPIPIFVNNKILKQIIKVIKYILSTMEQKDQKPNLNKK